MSYQVGVDLLAITRVKPMVENKMQGFLQQFTSEEHFEAKKSTNQTIYYAERFAAKEAVLKSLNFQIRRENFVEIQILNNDFGKPVVKLSGKAAELFSTRKLKQIDLSLSYEMNLVMAVVVVG